MEEKNNGKLGVGSKIRVSAEFYQKQKNVTLPPYGEIKEVFEDENVSYIDMYGRKWNIDLRYCEEDKIDSFEIKEDDSNVDKGIKSIMKSIDDIGREDYEENLEVEIIEFLEGGSTFNNGFIRSIDLIRAAEKYKEIIKEEYAEKMKEENLSYEDLENLQVEYEYKTGNAEICYETLNYVNQMQANSAARKQVSEAQGQAKAQQQAQPQGKFNPMDYLEDMIESAELGDYDRALGRDIEINSVVETLSRKDKRNGILVGKQGCGKTAIMQEIANRVSEGELEALEGKKILSLNVEGLVAGTKYRGEFEEKVKTVLDFCKKDKDIVVFIDEIHKIMGAGGNTEGGMNLGNMLKTELTRGLSVIGATTVDEYKNLTKDAALARRFSIIDIREQEPDVVKWILNVQKAEYEKFHRVKTSDLLVDAIVDTFDQKNYSTSNIDYAKTAMDTICTKMKVNKESEAESYKKFMLEQTYNKEETNEYVKKATCGFATGVEEKSKAKEEPELTGVSKEYYDKLVSLENLDKEIEAESLALAEAELNNTMLIKEKEFAGLEA